MTVVKRRVSRRGQISLPSEVCRRWHLTEGGSVEITDLGSALLVTPEGRHSLRGLLAKVIEEAGGYPTLANKVATEEPGLA